MHLFGANRLKPTFWNLTAFIIFSHLHSEQRNHKLLALPTLPCSSPTRDNPDFKNGMSLGGVICFTMRSRLRKELSFVFFRDLQVPKELLKSIRIITVI